MALIRKLRRVGNSLSVIVPSGFVKAMGLSAGDGIEFLVTGRDEFRIRKAQAAARENVIEGSAASNDAR